MNNLVILELEDAVPYLLEMDNLALGFQKEYESDKVHKQIGVRYCRISIISAARLSKLDVFGYGTPYNFNVHNQICICIVVSFMKSMKAGAWLRISPQNIETAKWDEAELQIVLGKLFDEQLIDIRKDGSDSYYIRYRVENLLICRLTDKGFFDKLLKTDKIKSIVSTRDQALEVMYQTLYCTVKRSILNQMIV